METRKKGISLIALIITIIVMIILAAAIILSLSNSGIIGKANKAKKDSDTANLKEYVNVLEAEWELMDTDEKSSSGYGSKEAYVNGELYKKYPDAALGADGEVYAGLNEAARKAIVAGIQIGDVVTGYTLETIASDKVYKTSGDENTAPDGTELTKGVAQTTIKRIEYATWKYIGIGENGEILIAPDMVDSVEENQKIKLSGKGGYLNGPQELNDMCAAMYSTTKGTARSMNIEDITRILDYKGDKGYYISAAGEPVWTKTPKKISEIGTLSSTSTPESGKAIGEYYVDYYSISKTSTDILKSATKSLKEKLTKFVYTSNIYWLASSCVDAYFDFGYAQFNVLYVDSSAVYSNWLFGTGGSSICWSCAARPVIQLNSNVQLTKVSDGNWSI